MIARSELIYDSIYIFILDSKETDEGAKIGIGRRFTVKDITNPKSHYDL